MNAFVSDSLSNDLAKVEVSIPLSSALAEQLLFMNEKGKGNFSIRIEGILSIEGSILILTKYLQAVRSDCEFEDEIIDEEFDLKCDAYDFGQATSECMFISRPF